LFSSLGSPDFQLKLGWFGKFFGDFLAMKRNNGFLRCKLRVFFEKTEIHALKFVYVFLDGKKYEKL